MTRIVRGAIAGVVLTRAGKALELPGLPGHASLSATSPVIAVAAQKLAEGAEHLSFLSPLPGGKDLSRVGASPSWPLQSTCPPTSPVSWSLPHPGS
jgi:hypothetical protein